ncbi:hypothetical protein HDV05_000973 [Chytridiales sp. JEL 0842]|nr:hypothetical protein HDV05_000973 [Chytridiales sp. JEL 0842]
MEALSDIVMDMRVSSSKASELIETDVGSPQQMKALLDHAKKMVLQLRSLMAYESEIELRQEDGSLPNYEDLVGKLQDAFRNQKHINTINARLMAMNYMVNVSNIAKNRNMQKAIARGRKQILELQETVSTLEETMDTLNAEVDSQRKSAERLKTSLDNTRALLETSMGEYRKEMNRQAEVIRKQQSIFGDVYKNKLNQDFIVDST